MVSRPFPLLLRGRVIPCCNPPLGAMGTRQQPGTWPSAQLPALIRVRGRCLIRFECLDQARYGTSNKLTHKRTTTRILICCVKKRLSVLPSFRHRIPVALRFTSVSGRKASLKRVTQFFCTPTYQPYLEIDHAMSRHLVAYLAFSSLRERFWSEIHSNRPASIHV